MRYLLGMQPFDGAARALRERSAAVVDRWLAAYSRSSMRLPGPVDLRALLAPATGIAAALALAIAEPGCAPGSPFLRETEKLLAFAGGSFGMLGASAFDVAAFTTTLRDVLLDEAAEPHERSELGRLFDWLGALALEGYASSRLDALRLRYRDSLDRGTPVVMITRELPAALLVGEPDRTVLETVFGRLLLAVVRVDAKALLLDGSGLSAPEAPAVLDALGAFARHPKLAAVICFLVGLPGPAEAVWKDRFPARVQVVTEERFDDAVARALRLVPRR